jgi:hypothetical protein
MIGAPWRRIETPTLRLARCPTSALASAMEASTGSGRPAARIGVAAPAGPAEDRGEAHEDDQGEEYRDDPHACSVPRPPARKRDASQGRSRPTERATSKGVGRRLAEDRGIVGDVARASASPMWRARADGLRSRSRSVRIGAASRSRTRGTGSRSRRTRPPRCGRLESSCGSGPPQPPEDLVDGSRCRVVGRGSRSARHLVASSRRVRRGSARHAH